MSPTSFSPWRSKALVLDLPRIPRISNETIVNRKKHLSNQGQTLVENLQTWNMYHRKISNLETTEYHSKKLSKILKKIWTTMNHSPLHHPSKPHFVGFPRAQLPTSLPAARQQKRVTAWLSSRNQRLVGFYGRFYLFSCGLMWNWSAFMWFQTWIFVGFMLALWVLWTQTRPFAPPDSR